MKRKFDFKNSSGAVVLSMILLFAVMIVLNFFATAGVLWLLCRAFHWTWWSWSVSSAVWMTLGLLSGTGLKVKVE